GIDADENDNLKTPKINIGGDDVFSDYEPSDIGSLYSSANDADVENVNDTPRDITSPSQDICKKVVELIEFYLSDTNLAKDMFLLKHVSKHREGYISVRLMTSYKKVKRITKDWNIVSESLKASTFLELNEEGNKVRRRNPLPLHLDEQTRAFRTILATNINKDEAQMDTLADLFGQYGEMFALQLHKPGGRILDEVRQMEVTRPGISEKVCAIVEYEHVYCARQALRTINNNAECNIDVIEIPSKYFMKRNRSPFDNESAYFSASETDSSVSDSFPNKKSLHLRPHKISSVSPVSPRRCFHDNKKSPVKTVKTHETSIRSSSISSSGASPISSKNLSLKLIPPGSNPRRRQVQTPSLSTPPDSPYLGRRQLFDTNVKGSNLSSAPTSPWLRRRNDSNDSHTPDSSRCNSPLPLRRAWTPCQTPTSPSLLLWSPHPSPNVRRRNTAPDVRADNVIRFPRGPDGTKGFHKRLNVQIGQA
ncbi:unnamed protein product, partial [Meganyctiphanes norvegica]